jgi:integrase
MHRVYKIGQRHELVTKNPVQHVEMRTKTNYRAIVITPAQTLTILESFPNSLHYALVLTCAATALRASEILSLRWSDICWAEERIRISKRWAKGEDGDTKTEASDGYVPLHPMLADRLRAWQLRFPTLPRMIFCFRPRRRRENRRSTLRHSLPIICDRQQSKQEFRLRQHSASDLTI